VEEVTSPETEIQQEKEVNVLDVTSEAVTEAIANELEELSEETTDFDETKVNTDNAEEEETQNEGEEPAQEKQNWADG
jgi:hypothetical protein